MANNGAANAGGRGNETPPPAPPQVAAAAEGRITKCHSDLGLFRQYSGQCWNDASIVLLLFSDGLGDMAQEKMELDEGTLAEVFESFCRTHKDFLDFVRTEDIPSDELELFVEKAKVYLLCLQKRFLNWKKGAARPKGVNRPPVERCSSYVYSICQEAAGPEANELLMPPLPPLKSEMPDFSTKSEEEQKNIRLDESVLRAFYRRPPSPKNTTKGYLEKALEYQGRENIEALLKENLQFSDVRGYDLNRFGRLTAVLVGFFSDMQITILSEAESSFDVLGGKLQQSNIFGKYVFVYSKFPRAESRIVNVITRPYDVETINKYDFLKETPPGVNFSSVVELRDLESIVSGHAITFLNCNGEKFIYDDNVLSVIPIDWSVLFNPESNYDTLYYVITGSLPFLVAHFVNRDSVSEFIMLFPSGKTKQLLGKRIYTAEEKFTILKRSFSTKKSVFYLIEGFSFCISNFTGLEMPNENNTNTSAYWYNKPFSGGKRQFRAKRARRLRPRGTLKRRRPQKTRRR